VEVALSVGHRGHHSPIQFRQRQSGRPAAGRRRRVEARWRSYAGPGPTSQAATPSRRHDARAGLHSSAPSLPVAKITETEPPLPFFSGELKRELHRITGR
jgi:hypothetical protein